MSTTLAGKLQLKAGRRLAVLWRPQELALDAPGAVDVASPGDVGADDATLVFVCDRAGVEERWHAVAAAGRDGLAWMAYPKGGRLGTDLDRDVVWALMRAHGVEAVRQVAVDAVWSALRFRAARGR